MSLSHFELCPRTCQDSTAKSVTMTTVLSPADFVVLVLGVVSAGLGTEPGSCSIVSGEDNKGDGIVLCGQDPQAVMRERGWNVSTYKVREELGFRN